jgi:hypothetical protein
MAHARLGHKDQAQKYYNDAITWMEANLPDQEDLLFYRAEAGKLLGVEPKPKANSTSPAEKPEKIPTR